MVYVSYDVLVYALTIPRLYCEVCAPEGLDPYTITETDECW